MFKSNIAKIFNKSGKNRDEVVTITTENVVLEALCAYRDQLIMSDENNLETAAKLSLVHLAIEDTWLNTPVK